MIFLDVDGVLAAFTESAAELHGYDMSKWPAGTYAFEEVLGITSAEFWRPINDEGAAFWRSLPLYPWALELFEMCRPFGVTLLSTPSHQASSALGKVEWIRATFGDKFRDYALSAMPKYLLAGPGSILIDDFPHNIDAWRSAGGRAIEFPQPWNRLHHVRHDRLGFVRSELVKPTR